MNITEEDFTEIIKRNKDRLRHLCRIYAERPEDEQDIYQEMLIGIWRSMPSFRGDSKIDTWIYRIAVNTAISYMRKKKVNRNYFSKFRKTKEVEKGINSMVTGAEDNDNSVLLYEAISKLNPSERAIITMYLDDFSYNEIAFVTQITTNNVGVKLNRIKQKLTRIIRSLNGTY